MFSFLFKPFPVTYIRKKTILTDFFIGAFVALFLLMFQPFGINEWQPHNKFLKLLGFGLVSFIAPLVVHTFITVLPKKITEDKWNVWKEIVVVITVLVCVALGNLLYGNFLGIMPLNLKGFIGAFLFTVLLGIFPVTYHVINKHNKLLNINTVEALKMNSFIQVPEAEAQSITVHENQVQNKPDDQKIKFVSENEKEALQLQPEQLLFIESADNYSCIFFVENNGIKKQMIRSTLKRLESQINLNYVMRCHRAFIVNLKNVSSVSGNAAGYKLTLRQSDRQVPVSRSYGNEVIERFRSLN